MHMGTEYTSVRLTEKAYETLKSRKREEESFSDTVNRLAGERPLRELEGILTDEEADEIEDALDESYENYSRELEEMWE